MTVTGKALAVAGIMILLVLVYGLRRDEQREPELRETELKVLPNPIEAVVNRTSPNALEETPGPDNLIDAKLYVRFTDGEAITIKYLKPPTHPRFPDGRRVVDFYDQWVEQATAGNADIALALDDALAHCRSAYQSEEDLNEAIDQFYQTRTVPSPRRNGKPPQFVGSGDGWLKSVESSLRDTFHKCSGLTDEHLEVGDTWLVLAADLGNAHAAQALGRKLITTNPTEAIRYLEIAWLSGDLEAATGIAFLYSGGLRDHGEPIMAHAFWNLYVQVNEEFRGAGARRLSGQPSEELTRRYAMKLSPLEMRQSEEIAKNILRNNPNCCFSRSIQM